MRWFLTICAALALWLGTYEHVQAQGCYGGSAGGYAYGGGLSVPLQLDLGAPQLRFAPGFAGGYFNGGGPPPVPFGAPPFNGGGYYSAGGFNGGYPRPFGQPGAQGYANGYAGRPRVSEGRIDGNGRLY